MKVKLTVEYRLLQLTSDGRSWTELESSHSKEDLQKFVKENPMELLNNTLKIEQVYKWVETSPK